MEKIMITSGLDTVDSNERAGNTGVICGLWCPTPGLLCLPVE